ncbi:MAG: hypothetical protein JWO05_3848 [Gemmatimonadetes bacterium]|nr:hypothetical protein [Gemmatimonadota bacterium]
MKIQERSAQVWPLLAFAAHNRQLLSYDLVSKLTGMPAVGLGAVLEPIQSYCLLKALPPLTVLVVNKGTGMPGAGFLASDVPRQTSSVFEHDWLAASPPSPEQLADAVRELPSNANG